MRLGLDRPPGVLCLPALCAAGGSTCSCAVSGGRLPFLGGVVVSAGSRVSVPEVAPGLSPVTDSPCNCWPYDWCLDCRLVGVPGGAGNRPWRRTRFGLGVGLPGWLLALPRGWRVQGGRGPLGCGALGPVDDRGGCRTMLDGRFPKSSSSFLVDLFPYRGFGPRLTFRRRRVTPPGF